MRFRVCLIQMPCVEGVREKNFERARFLTYDLDKHDGVQFIVLPELFAIGFNYEQYAACGVGIPGPTQEFLQEFAREKESYIVSTDIEKSPKKYYNTLIMVNPDGNVLGSYRKIHPFQAEKVVFDGGNRLTIFDVEGLRVGVQICYDLRFPEVTRKLAEAGADLILMPAAWPDPRGLHWDNLVLSRAIENQLFFAAANRVRFGFDGKTYFGHSQMVDPWGVRMTRINSEERIVVEVGDTSSITAVRSQITCWSDRSPDTYNKVDIIKG